MEGFAVVGLAANILQFIQTAKHLVSAGREILDSGTKKEYLELELISKELHSRADRLKLSGNFTSISVGDSEDSIEELACQSNDIADELLGILSKLKLRDDRNEWSSIILAFKTQWHDKKIVALCGRLDRIGKAVNACLADQSTLGIHARFDELLRMNRQLEASRTQDIMELRKDFDQALRNNENNINEQQSADKIGKAASDGLHFSVEQKVLAKLWFVRLEDRYSSVSLAHSHTLAWVFEATSVHDEHVERSNFIKWLRSEDTLYWVSGRPASGKSTLMKFICTHKQTTEHLKMWANGNEVVTAEYFFWNAGKNDLQKSQEGLLRSLLYQILRACPDYIRLVFADLWRWYDAANSMGPNESNRLLNPNIWNDIQDLRSALERTCNFLTQSGKRLCFFIDGLDEYAGDPDQVIDLVRMLGKINHVKTCVSSRQWNAFEQAFGKNSTEKLYMQDFNAQDINAYINDAFANDDNFQELEDKETRGKALVEEIVTAANGVFLWVVLVVRSFQEGLREGDSITRLQRRLRELPTELEEYFDRILFHDVDASYREQGAQMFLLALTAKENLPLMAYWFLDEDPPEHRQPLGIQQMRKRQNGTKKRLIASCKGLLEPQYQPMVQGQNSLGSALVFDSRVDFLHRTVRDYLDLPTTDIKGWAAAGFNADATICRALYSLIKTAPHGCEYGPHVSALYQMYSYHADALRRSTEKDPITERLTPELIKIIFDCGVTTGVNHLKQNDPDGGLTADWQSNDAIEQEQRPAEHSIARFGAMKDVQKPKSSRIKRLISKLSRREVETNKAYERQTNG
ncbi:hypothetical protein J4E89_009378 [Alternaria sp. Ai002NY15]|nr:hypothetical protein J4E89_009378 [Alternaria sp. Ai002NY15]